MVLVARSCMLFLARSYGAVNIYVYCRILIALSFIGRCVKVDSSGALYACVLHLEDHLRGNHRRSELSELFLFIIVHFRKLRLVAPRILSHLAIRRCSLRAVLRGTCRGPCRFGGPS